MRCFILVSVCCLVLAFISATEGASLQGENKDGDLTEKLKLKLRELLENKKKYTAKSEEHPVNVNTNQNSEVHKEREVHGNSGHQRQFKQRPERRRLSHTGSQKRYSQQIQHQRQMQGSAVRKMSQHMHARGMPTNARKHPKATHRDSERRELRSGRSNTNRSSQKKRRQRIANKRMHYKNDQKRRQDVQRNEKEQRKQFNKAQKSLDKKSFFYPDYGYGSDYHKCVKAIEENCLHYATIPSLNSTAYNCSVYYYDLSYDYTCPEHYNEYDWSEWNDYNNDWSDWYDYNNDWSDWNDYNDWSDWNDYNDWSDWNDYNNDWSDWYDYNNDWSDWNDYNNDWSDWNNYYGNYLYDYNGNDWNDYYGNYWNHSAGWNDYYNHGYGYYDHNIHYNESCSIPCDHMYDNEFYNCVVNKTESLMKKVELGGGSCLYDALCAYQNLIIAALEKGLWWYK